MVNEVLRESMSSSIFAVAMDPSASLPVQVYLWSESAERGFVEKTSATIMMLLGFLIVMNSLAVYARQKFEKKWN